MADRWFVVPVVSEVVAGSDTRVPKYGGQVDSYAGQPQDFSDGEYSDLPWYPSEMYVVRFYADTATLDAIEANDDAFTTQEYDDVTKGDVAAYLNDKLGLDNTWEEYEQQFVSGTV